MNHGYQTCKEFSLKIEPEPLSISRHFDFFGNATHIFSIEEAHQSLIVQADSQVQVFKPELPDPEATPTCEEIRETLLDLKTAGNLEAVQFSYGSMLAPVLEETKEFGKKFFLDKKPVLSCVLDLFEYIQKEFTFDTVATDINTPVLEFLKNRHGVCQDFAHLTLSAMRSCGLPAYYVSGYLLTSPPEGSERLLGADASHAYISVFVPGYGWISMDPTNNLICEDEHIMVATGRDFEDISVLSGTVMGGNQQDLIIEVTVAPDEEWQQLIGDSMQY